MLKAFIQAERGQGVVEYAGALVIATVLMGAVIITTPPTLYQFLLDLQESAFQYLADAASEIGS